MAIKYLLGDQLKYLEQAGFEMHAVTSPGPYAERVEEMGIRWHPATISRAITPAQDMRGALDVAAICRKQKFTIVHVHTPKGMLIGRAGSILARVPITVQTLHGFYFFEMPPSPKRRLFKEIEVRGCRGTDHVLSQNPEDVDMLLAEGLIDPSKISVLGNGIDIDRFSPPDWAPDERRARRVAVGLDPDALVIGIVGRFVLEKGYLELCKALPRLLEKFPNVQVLAIGTKPEGQERAWEIVDPRKDPTVGKRFVCLHDRDDMHELYPLMDVFTLPSHRDGFPRAPMEASATGVPVVTTNIRGCRQTVTDGLNGLLVPAANAEELGNALGQLLSDADLRTAMGKRGRERAIAEFDQRLAFAKVADCYNRLLDERGLGRG